MISSRTLILAATAGSAGLMLGALGFQYLGELPPCKMCYWQRYPHVAAIAIGAVALLFAMPALAWLGLLAALTTAVIGGYHSGVERGWWEGPTSCTSGSIDGLTAEQLLERLMNAPVARCDEVPWEFLTLSMASWNMVISLALAVLWFLAARNSLR